MGAIDPKLLNVKIVCPVDKRYHGKCYTRKATSVQTSKKLLNYQQFIKSHMKNRKFRSLDAVNEEMRRLGKLWKNKKRGR